MLKIDHGIEGARVRDPGVLPLHSIALALEWRRRVVAIQHYDRYIARASGHPALQALWRELKKQDVEDAKRLREWIDRGEPRPAS